MPGDQKIMTVEVEQEECADRAAVRKQEAQRRHDIVRRFTDQFITDPVVITPRWQRAIDNYKRAKGIEAVENAD